MSQTNHGGTPPTASGGTAPITGPSKDTRRASSSTKATRVRTNIDSENPAHMDVTIG